MTVQDASAVAAAVADAHRREWAFVLAATVRVTRDLDVAEECAQDAFAAALTDWRTHGIPARPGAWLTTAAQAPRAERPPPPGRRAPVPAAARRGGDRARAPATDRTTARGAADPRRPAAADRDLLPPGARPVGAGGAHPAADVRAVHGRGGPRLPGQRADHGGADHAGEEEDRRRPHPVPRAVGRGAARAGGRRPVGGAPAVHHRATPPRPGRTLVRRDLVERSVQLGRMLRRLLPRDPAVAGLLALLLLTDARRETRTATDGRLLLLEEQDRTPVGPRGHRRGRGAGARGAAGPAAEPLRAAGRDRRRARRVAALGRHRLARDRRAVRRAHAAVALAGGRAEPRRRGRVRLRGRRPAWPRSTRWAASRSWPATATCPRRARTSSGGSAGSTRPARPTRRRCSSPRTPSSGSSSPAGCARSVGDRADGHQRSGCVVRDCAVRQTRQLPQRLHGRGRGGGAALGTLHEWGRRVVDPGRARVGAAGVGVGVAFRLYGNGAPPGPTLPVGPWFSASWQG